VKARQIPVELVSLFQALLTLEFIIQTELTTLQLKTLLPKTLFFPFSHVTLSILDQVVQLEKVIKNWFHIKELGAVMLTREEALNLVKKNVAKRNFVYHMLAVEAIMKSLAKHFGEDEHLWGLTGLLHDIDYGKTEATPEKHAMLAEEILNEFALPQEVIKAIKAHNFQYTHVKPETRMEKALIACDAVSGLLVACALVMPSKKLKDVKVETVIKKLKAKDFARGVERERILFCEEIGIPRKKFFEITLDGLKNISSEIGL